MQCLQDLGGVSDFSSQEHPFCTRKAKEPLQERVGRQAVVQELQELEPGPAVLMESVSLGKQ